MRKFLVAAALLAVAACGEKAKTATDTMPAPMAPTMAPTPMDSAKADSVRKDSLGKDSVLRATARKDSAKAVKP